MSPPTEDAATRCTSPRDRLSLEDYNYAHFRARHVGWEVKALLRRRGIRPGRPAPDFALPSVDGDPVRLSELLDRPVLLHFGSFT